MSKKTSDFSLKDISFKLIRTFGHLIDKLSPGKRYCSPNSSYLLLSSIQNAPSIRQFEEAIEALHRLYVLFCSEYRNICLFIIF
jgi:hypothetical protein